MADSAENKEKAIWVIKHACKNKLEELLSNDSMLE